MADLFHFFLSGRAAAELTLASTTQLLDARERDWSRRILVEQGIPPSVMPEIVPPATVLDPLRDDLVEETGLADAPPVIAGASHDTACAVAATPATGEGGWAYVSSGTWSLVGVELEAPVLSREVLGHDFTNEAGVFGTTRFLRNVPGLWLVQECRRQWAREGEELSYDRLAELAEAAPPAQAWLDLSDPAFFEPGDMPAKIRRHCEATGQKPPATRGDLVRCALESLARAWLESIRSAERLTGERVDRVHIVGGGSRLRLLARLAANLIGVPVVAGPAEATATGNLLLQAAARGDLPDLAALREVSRQSADVATFRPRERGPR